jgi:hypothetical protein
VTGFLKKLFGPARQPVQQAEHPILGTLSYDPESESWGKRITFADQQLRLSVSGEFEPDLALLEQAASLQAELPALVAKLPAFLEHEAVQAPEFAMEIRSLKLEDIAVWWPKQPEAVMIWFKGPSQERMWHCSYTSGELNALVYDC